MRAAALRSTANCSCKPRRRTCVQRAQPDYFDVGNGNTKVNDDFKLHRRQRKKVLIKAAGTAAFKAASKEFTIAVAKNTPVIVWRTPMPVIRTKAFLTAYAG